MTHSKVVHCQKAKYDVYIGRGSKWGNPYHIGKDGNRNEVIAKYKNYLIKNNHLMKSLPELRGKILGCWCAPRKCHGEVLIELLKSGGAE